MAAGQSVEEQQHGVRCLPYVLQPLVTNCSKSRHWSDRGPGWARSSYSIHRAFSTGMLLFRLFQGRFEAARLEGVGSETIRPIRRRRTLNFPRVSALAVEWHTPRIGESTG